MSISNIKNRILRFDSDPRRENTQKPIFNQNPTDQSLYNVSKTVHHSLFTKVHHKRSGIDV